MPTQIFNELPPRRQYPDYYNLIKSPISLKEIRQRIDKGKYPDPGAFAAAVHLMLKNAMTYNAVDSVVHQDAVLLKVSLE